MPPDSPDFCEVSLLKAPQEIATAADASDFVKTLTTWRDRSDMKNRERLPQRLIETAKAFRTNEPFL
jgi:hypothetical protein